MGLEMEFCKWCAAWQRLLDSNGPCLRSSWRHQLIKCLLATGHSNGEEGPEIEGGNGKVELVCAFFRSPKLRKGKFFLGFCPDILKRHQRHHNCNSWLSWCAVNLISRDTWAWEYGKRGENAHAEQGMENSQQKLYQCQNRPNVKRLMGNEVGTNKIREQKRTQRKQENAWSTERSDTLARPEREEIQTRSMRKCKEQRGWPFRRALKTAAEGTKWSKGIISSGCKRYMSIDSRNFVRLARADGAFMREKYFVEIEVLWDSRSSCRSTRREKSENTEHCPISPIFDV